MNKLKICIISRFFYPEVSPRAFRTTELAIELARQGHEVLVVLPDLGVDFSEFEIKYNLKFDYYGKLKWKGIDFGKSKLGSILQRVQFRILNSALDFPHTELFFKVKQFLKNKTGFNIIISIARPHPIHWGVAAAMKKNPSLTNCWIADCGDPFTGATVDKFKKWFYLRWVENWAFNLADYITIPIESSIPAYDKEFIKKIRIIPQGFRMNEPIVSVQRPENVTPSFAYAGSFIPGLRDPNEFMDFLINQKMDYRFYIFTNSIGVVKSSLKRSEGKIKLMGIKQRHELLSFLKGMDFLVNFDNNTSVHSPSKLIDYAITGLPILNISRNLDKNMASAFLQGDYSCKYDIGNLEQYDIKNVAMAFISLSDELRIELKCIG